MPELCWISCQSIEFIVEHELKHDATTSKLYILQHLIALRFKISYLHSVCVCVQCVAYRIQFELCSRATEIIQTEFNWWCKGTHQITTNWLCWKSYFPKTMDLLLSFSRQLNLRKWISLFLNIQRRAHAHSKLRSYLLTSGKPNLAAKTFENLIHLLCEKHLSECQPNYLIYSKRSSALRRLCEHIV